MTDRRRSIPTAAGGHLLGCSKSPQPPGADPGLRVGTRHHPRPKCGTKERTVQRREADPSLTMGRTSEAQKVERLHVPRIEPREADRLSTTSTLTESDRKARVQVAVSPNAGNTSNRATPITSSGVRSAKSGSGCWVKLVDTLSDLRSSPNAVLSCEPRLATLLSSLRLEGRGSSAPTDRSSREASEPGHAELRDAFRRTA